MPTWEGPDRQAASAPALPPTAPLHTAPEDDASQRWMNWRGKGGLGWWVVEKKNKRRGLSSECNADRVAEQKGTEGREIYQLFDRG